MLLRDRVSISCQAAYHGVPVVAMPFFADQPLNAMKAASKVQVTLTWITYHYFDPLALQEKCD